MKSKITGFQEAVALIPSNSQILISSLMSVLCPDRLLLELSKAFKEKAAPCDLTVFTPCRPGWAADSGMENLAEKGLLKRVISGSFNTKQTPRFAAMIHSNAVEAYSFSMGVMYQWIHAAASGMPGLITQVGLDTYVDPHRGGGRINEAAKEDLVEHITLEGELYLRYLPQKFDVALLRGTTADEWGNITCEEEPVVLALLRMAQAAKSNGGKVIIQVKRIAKGGSLHSRQVVIPGALVDVVVVDPEQKQSIEPYNPYWTGELCALDDTARDIPLDSKKVILRRALLELKAGYMVNLGVGIPVDIPTVAKEEGIFDEVIFSTEHGCIGGYPSGVSTFGTHSNPQALLDTVSNFAMYHGGCLDIAYLGFAEIDKQGNVNVSYFNGALRGSGGFIDITHKTKTVVLCGTLTSGGLDVSIDKGNIVIRQEGKHTKFVKQVGHITFSGKEALRKGQRVLFITERCVLQLMHDGLHLLEVAPGIDVQKDILGRIEFPIIYDTQVVPMNPVLFEEQKMGIKLD